MDSVKERRKNSKYKMRWFYSKGAFLVLVWVFLSTTAILLTFRTAEQLSDNHYSIDWSYAVPAILAIVIVLPLGWLAHAKFGVYNMTKFGQVSVFLSMFITSIYILFLENKFVKDNQYMTNIFLCFSGSIFAIGVIAYIVSILQLGLDQMPDASSSNITSFIAWFVFCFYGSIWISDTLFGGLWMCLGNQTHSAKYSTSNIQLWSLIPVSCMCVVIVTDSLLAKKWLIKEPKTPQTLKTVYQVVKFAWKHKAPLNRSALTYWEEDVPSRMDLGKSRFGGPFSTEQVEDVKIVLRLLVLSIPMWVFSFSVMYGPISYKAPITTTINYNWSRCNNYALTSITYRSDWWVLITTVLFEFVIYPILRDRLPSILKRIGIIAFTNFVLSILFLTLSLVHHYNKNINILLWVISISFYFTRGIQICILHCAILELICAQAPYSTRGFFTGYFIVFTVALDGIATRFTDHPLKYCNDCNIHLILFGVKGGISLFGLFFYCLLAHWYKMRVRDEEYCTQRVVEEVYDRYLSAAAGN